MAKDKHLLKGKIGYKLTALVILFSSIITLITTVIQLSLDYRDDITRIDEQFNNIRFAYLDSIASSVWFYDDALIQSQLSGLEKLPDIEFAAVKINKKIKWFAGNLASQYPRTEHIPLSYTYPNQKKTDIGTLIVSASIDNVIHRLVDKALYILISNAVKTFIITGLLLFLFWHLITRHIHQLSEYLLSFSLQAPDIEFKRLASTQRYDELDHLSDAINTMKAKLAENHQTLENQKKAISDSQEKLKLTLNKNEELLAQEKEFKSQLELRVKKRTVTLQEKTDALEESIGELKAVQKLLLEADKMAALGNMAAGIAHEINTPIGICLISANIQRKCCTRVMTEFHEGTLTEETFIQLISELNEACELFERNIARASETINNFKLIAVNQAHDIKQKFLLENHIRSVIQLHKPKYRHLALTFHVSAPSDLQLTSHPGLYHQILSNLITNSLIHGFDNIEEAIISIDVATDNENLIITYKDNGCGINEEQRKRIFEPFYTTRRGDGGTGLGMSIVYNIITTQLKGSIYLAPNTEGFSFTATIPEKFSLLREQ